MMNIFSNILAAAVLSAQASPPVTALPLTQTHKRDLDCVAALAVVASEQEKANETAMEYPLVIERGRIYAGIVGQRVLDETGQSKEQVRQAILDAVTDQQALTSDVADPDMIIEAKMAACLPRLDTEVPLKKQPSLNQCAAMLQLAYEEVYSREKLSKTAQDLKTLAFVLDSRARENMKNKGYSGNESDAVLASIRENLIAAERSGTSEPLAIDHCFTLAAPDSKSQNFDH